MSIVAFFAGYAVGMGATLFALGFCRAASAGNRLDQDTVEPWGDGGRVPEEGR
jgi:hypothetical protein